MIAKSVESIGEFFQIANIVDREDDVFVRVGNVIRIATLQGTREYWRASKPKTICDSNRALM
jgi:hypothetical protein